MRGLGCSTQQLCRDSCFALSFGIPATFHHTRAGAVTPLKLSSVSASPGCSRYCHSTLLTAPMASFVPTPATENVDVSADSIIREPVRESGVDVLIVFAPGALTPATDYIPLCDEIQTRSEFRVWIAIINPPNNIISTEIVEGSFEGVLERMKSRGFKCGALAIDNVFVVGHSWGAWTSRTVALRRAQAFVQMGSVFPVDEDDLAQYPKPVLTINGELDGQLTLAPTARHAGEIFNVEKDMGAFNTYGRKPVVLVSGMNHAQLSHGVPNRSRGDMDAEILIEEARRTVGELISSFISVQADGPQSSGLAKLERAVRSTQQVCKAYWEALEDQCKHVEEFQLEVAGVEAVRVVVVEHDYQDNFVYSKPWIETSPEVKIYVNTYLNPYGKYGLVKSLWIKMKSREAVHAALGETSEGGRDDQERKLAAKFNERTFNRALELVPEAARVKFMERGRKLRFIDDRVITESALEWIKSDLTFTPAEDGLTDVQSSVVISPLGGLPRFAGMHYMKLLTIAGAMQWILTDCFR